MIGLICKHSRLVRLEQHRLVGSFPMQIATGNLSAIIVCRTSPTKAICVEAISVVLAWKSAADRVRLGWGQIFPEQTNPALVHYVR